MVDQVVLPPSQTLLTRWEMAGAAQLPGRFRLYASYACPWSHRVMIARALRGLHGTVAVVEVEPVMDGAGWRLDGGHLADRYRLHAPEYSGRATVPLMVEVTTGLIVSNESADLMRVLGTMMSGSGRPLYTAEQATACDAWNQDIQINVNAAIYRGGLVPDADVRRRKTDTIIASLTRLDRQLADRPYLVDDARPLEPDWRLWTTLARYDLAYRPFLLSPSAPDLAAFPNLSRFFADLIAVPGIAATHRPADIVAHYAARVRDLQALAHSSQGETT